MKKAFFAILTLSVLLTACKTPQAIVDVPVEIRTLDTLTIQPDEDESTYEEGVSEKVYHASHSHAFDLIHTTLELRFDWEKETVSGKADLTLKPWFYPQQYLVLDAKGFEINSIKMTQTSEVLVFDYDQQQITIDLERLYTNKEEVEISIDYTAFPSVTGGSSAITSDKGLYFIDPRDDDPDKPTQIWTQGETESNSKWFPTIDKPNERCTQEMFVTVESKYKTLSNGKFMGSVEEGDGMRTDHWVMDQPHAPYLFMLAIGEYAVVRDQWEGIPLSYWVEPDYEDYAKDIFDHTPEMLTFFSEKFNYKYPWPKFDQIIVRDYVSGAMENTTSVVFGEFVQKTKRELIDNSNDLIVAHEMMHHWFGDLVTCESWSNLTLNEGFANYAEYLWLEHQDGKDAADHHLYDEQNGYFMGYGDFHPLIHYSFESREDMFDAHSYNKGGAVLHMLRNQIGDEAFWAGLHKYLVDNEYSAVEVDELRLAFEDVTGLDLNWFFDQWYLSTGHPELDIDYTWDKTEQLLTFTVDQIQDEEDFPKVFTIPTSIDIYTASGVERKELNIDEGSEKYEFIVSETPYLVVFDPDHTLLAKIYYTKGMGEYAYQYEHAKTFYDRHEAINELRFETDSEMAVSVLKLALKDPYWYIRQMAIGALEDVDLKEGEIKAIAGMVREDPHSSVRRRALELLQAKEYDQIVSIAADVLEKEQAYPVVSSALTVLDAADPLMAAKYIGKLEKDNSPAIIGAISSIYANTGDVKYLPYFESKMDKLEGMAAMEFYPNYIRLSQEGGDDLLDAALNKMHARATDMNVAIFQRIGAAKAIYDVKESSSNLAVRNKMEEFLTDIKEKETNEQLKQFYIQTF